jgi:ABC-2 type transport system ATP-binding protein
MISIINLQKSFGEKCVLQNINLRFEWGKVYGIVGENGAGKTTLFRCMAGLEKHDGQVQSELQPLAHHLGYLPTDIYSLPKITGLEHLRLLCNARGKFIEDWESANLFNLPLNRFVEEYSTGMKKKLALNAVLLQNNDYYLFDEPFNGVDLQSNMVITEIILKLRAMRKVVVLSSHIFSTLAETCDELYLLHEGNVIDHATREDFGRLEKKLRAQNNAQQIVFDGQWKRLSS